MNPTPQKYGDSFGNMFGTQAEAAASYDKLKASGATPAPTNVITPESLKPTTPLTLPNQNTGITSSPLSGSINNAVSIAAVNQATTKENASNKYAGLTDLLSGRAGELANIDAQFAEQQKKIKAQEDAILLADEAHRKEIADLYGQGGATREQQTPAINEANRIYEQRNAERVIAYHISNGDFQAAKDTALKAVEAKYQGYKDQLDYLGKFISDNKQMSDADKMNLQYQHEKGLIDYKSQVELGQYAGLANMDAQAISTPGYTAQAPTGYTVTGADTGGLYSIAQKIAQSSGQDVNSVFESLKQANPNLFKSPLGNSNANWQIKAGDVINLPSASNPAPTNGSLLSATGLSQLAMEYLKNGSTALTRLNATTRQAVFNEVSNYTKNKGIDEATFRQQYSALGKTVEANTLRNNQAGVAESELDATLQNISSAAQEAGLGNLAKFNAAKVWAGKQLNDSNAITFKFHLEQLRREFAMYNAAIEGQIDQNGNIRQITDADLARADDVINNGFAKGSIDGFQKAVNASREKMGVVLKNSIDAQNKQVWNLFGVGDKYKSGLTTNDTFNMNDPSTLNSYLSSYGLPPLGGGSLLSNYNL